MKLKINYEEVEFFSNTLAELLNMHGFGNNSGVAVAVNEVVIPRPEWQGHMLKEGDDILVIVPAHGG